MQVNVICDVSEYDIKPAKHFEKVKFTINYNSLIIEICDKYETVITVVEVCINDAEKLSKLILLQQNGINKMNGCS